MHKLLKKKKKGNKQINNKHQLSLSPKYFWVSNGSSIDKLRVVTCILFHHSGLATCFRFYHSILSKVIIFVIP